jgi:hypothetical protein
MLLSIFLKNVGYVFGAALRSSVSWYATWKGGGMVWLGKELWFESGETVRLDVHAS